MEDIFENYPNIFTYKYLMKYLDKFPCSFMTAIHFVTNQYITNIGACEFACP